MSETFSITEADDLYTLVHDDLTMVVAPNTGARIISFLVDGVETLVQEGGAAQYGTTFWPSPQIWGWPPTASIPEIDIWAYTASEEDQRLTLRSEPNLNLGLSVTKTFGPAESESGSLGIAVTYAIKNEGDAVASFAAWEVSRVASGVVVYPTGPGGVLESSSLMPNDSIGHSFYTYDATDLMGVPKIFADGSDGWLAWANGGAEGTLVIKSFPDIAASEFAPEEAEIEIYADPSGDYMEVEQQGPYIELDPGAHLTWTVEWYGAAVPAPVTVENGSQTLVDLITQTL